MSTVANEEEEMLNNFILVPASFSGITYVALTPNGLSTLTLSRHMSLIFLGGECLRKEKQADYKTKIFWWWLR